MALPCRQCNFDMCRLCQEAVCRELAAIHKSPPELPHSAEYTLGPVGRLEGVPCEHGCGTLYLPTHSNISLKMIQSTITSGQAGIGI
eukprot:gene3316-5345_t